MSVWYSLPFLQIAKDLAIFFLKCRGTIAQLFKPDVFSKEILNLGLQGIKGIGGGPVSQLFSFVHFEICRSPIFLLSNIGSYVSQLSLLFGAHP